MSTRRFNRKLPVKLSLEEFVPRAEQVGEDMQRLEELENEKKIAASGFSADLKEIRKQLVGMGRFLATRIEDRDVECIEEKDFGTNEVRVTRTDTGEVVETRAMSAQERQGDMFDDEADEYGAELASNGETPVDEPEEGDEDEESEEDDEDGDDEEESEEPESEPEAAATVVAAPAAPAPSRPNGKRTSTAPARGRGRGRGSKRAEA